MRNAVSLYTVYIRFIQTGHVSHNVIIHRRFIPNEQQSNTKMFNDNKYLNVNLRLPVFFQAIAAQ